MKLVHWLAIALGATTAALAFTVGLLIGGARDSGDESPHLTFWDKVLAESQGDTFWDKALAESQGD